MTTMEEKSALDALLAVNLPEEEYRLERVGITLRLRGLSHEEGLELRDYGAKEGITTAQYEQRLLSKAVVFPSMSVGQVKSWQKASPAGEIDDVMKVVGRLSGMLKDSAKDAYKSVSEEPRAGE